MILLCLFAYGYLAFEAFVCGLDGLRHEGKQSDDPSDLRVHLFLRCWTENESDKKNTLLHFSVVVVDSDTIASVTFNFFFVSVSKNLKGTSVLWYSVKLLSCIFKL